MRRLILKTMAAAAASMLSHGAQAQSVDASYVYGRLDGLQRSLSDLSVRLEQLRAQDQQLQQQMERLQASLGHRLERLEAGGKPETRAAPARRSRR